MNIYLKSLVALCIICVVVFGAMALPELIKLFCIAVIEMAETLDKFRS